MLQRIFLYDPFYLKYYGDDFVCEFHGRHISYIYPAEKIKGIDIDCKFGIEIIVGTNYHDEINSGFGSDILIGMEGNDILDSSHDDAVFWGGEGDDSYNISHGNSLIFLEKNWGKDVYIGNGSVWLVLSGNMDIDKLKWTDKTTLAYKKNSSITFSRQNAYLDVKIVKADVEF